MLAGAFALYGQNIMQIEAVILTDHIIAKHNPGMLGRRY